MGDDFDLIRVVYGSERSRRVGGDRIESHISEDPQAAERPHVRQRRISFRLRRGRSKEGLIVAGSLPNRRFKICRSTSGGIALNESMAGRHLAAWCSMAEMPTDNRLPGAQ